jgi:hypothetical protein
MAGCKPPIAPYNLTGSTAAPLIPTLDPGSFTADETDPGFAKFAEDTLGDLASAADGWDAAVGDTTAGITTLEELSTAADADLAAILLLLDQQDPAAIGGQINDFAGDQPTAESLLGDVSGVTVPDLAIVPLVLPNGAATVTFGGDPETGGVVAAGSAPYTRHLQLLAVTPAIHNVDADGGSGPNPPFTSWGAVVQEADATGKLWWVYLVEIDPQAAGTYTGTAQYQVNLTIAGVTGTAKRSLVFQVVVQ